jgi:hypothetical protein
MKKPSTPAIRQALRGAHAPCHIFGYDRIELWLDRAELPIALACLKVHCAKVTPHLEQMTQNARWKLKLVILQPTILCLEILYAALGHDVGHQLSYVELAWDIRTINASHALKMRNTLLASVFVPHQRGSVLRVKTTWYYGRRENKGVKRGHVFVMYADRPSKLKNVQPDPDATPCLHMEWRATGKAALQNLGLATLADCIAFDHRVFWTQRLRIHELPAKADLGRLLQNTHGKTSTVGDAALRKRARGWLQEHSIKGKFVLHNALRDTCNLKRRLHQQDLWLWMAAMYKATRALSQPVD